MSDYPAFPKVPRFNRAAVITEKIDGTNGQISITDVTDGVNPEAATSLEDTGRRYVWSDDRVYEIRAGSRNRWLTRKDDNYGGNVWASR